MHIQRPIQMIKTILLYILIKEGITINLRVHSIVSNNIWVQLQSSARRGVVRIRTVAGAWIACATHVAHVNVLVHHAVGAVRRVDDVAWQQRRLVQIGASTRDTNRLLSG